MADMQGSLFPTIADHMHARIHVDHDIAVFAHCALFINQIIMVILLLTTRSWHKQLPIAIIVVYIFASLKNLQLRL